MTVQLIRLVHACMIKTVQAKVTHEIICHSSVYAPLLVPKGEEAKGLSRQSKLQWQTDLTDRPEGITQGGAHTPLLVQEGFSLLSGNPHIPHLPAHR